MLFRGSIFILLASLLVPSMSWGGSLSFRVLGVQGEVLLNQQVEITSEALGKLTDHIVQAAVQGKFLKAYEGSEMGVKSINGLGSALEVLSDTEMNAYGWCYRVDGKVIDLLAGQCLLTGNESSIEWYYAYAHLNRNDWTAMCVPANHQPVEE